MYPIKEIFSPKINIQFFLNLKYIYQVHTDIIWEDFLCQYVMYAVISIDRHVDEILDNIKIESYYLCLFLSISFSLGLLKTLHVSIQSHLFLEVIDRKPFMVYQIQHRNKIISLSLAYNPSLSFAESIYCLF